MLHEEVLQVLFCCGDIKDLFKITIEDSFVFTCTIYGFHPVREQSGQCLGIIKSQIPLCKGLKRIRDKFRLSSKVIDSGEAQSAVQQQGSTGFLINKKLILAASLVMYLIGGVGGGFAQTMLQYAVFRTVTGAATGMLSTTVFSIMFEHFPRQEDSAVVMGSYQVINTLSGTAISYLAGVLCVISWRTAQWINAVALLALVCVVVLLPKAPKEAGEAGEEEAAEGGRTSIDVPRAALTLLEGLLFIMAVSIFQFFVAVYLAERQLGDASFAGMLMSLAAITGAVINVVFARLFEKCRRYTVGWALDAMQYEGWKMSEPYDCMISMLPHTVICKSM